MKAPRLRLSYLVISGLLVTTALQSCNGGAAEKDAEKTAAAKADSASVAEIQAIAQEAFLYGLPIVMNYAIMQEYAVDTNSGQFKAPFNQIHNEHRVFTYEDTAVVTPNSDTPYSMLWLDLRAEPIVISVPAVEKSRYYSVQLIDGNTYNYGYIGSRATGFEAGNYMVVGPDWKGELPKGIKKMFRSTTPFSAAAFRTQLFNASDMPNVLKIQNGYKAQPLSAFLKQDAPVATPKTDFVPATTAGIKENFFQYLDAALAYIPINETNKEIRAKLAKMGIGPDKTVDAASLSPAHKKAIIEGMKAGEEAIAKYVATGMKNINGWNVGSLFGNSEFYNGDWVKRAAAAKSGIYGNDAVEAVYPMTRNDVNNEVLDASKHNYTITFKKGEFPPVNAFWSITMYNGKTQFLIKNDINRYLINSPMMSNMKMNEDGSLTIYIQKDSPGKDKESNWLPAPNGLIFIAMRLYWPKTEQPSILPPGAGTWSPPGVVKVN